MDSLATIPLSKESEKDSVKGPKLLVSDRGAGTGTAVSNENPILLLPLYRHFRTSGNESVTHDSVDMLAEASVSLQPG